MAPPFYFFVFFTFSGFDLGVSIVFTMGPLPNLGVITIVFVISITFQIRVGLDGNDPPTPTASK